MHVCIEEVEVVVVTEERKGMGTACTDPCPGWIRVRVTATCSEYIQTVRGCYTVRRIHVQDSPCLLGDDLLT